ncbi:unnamed protein product [Somion occarium]|uniref:Uncharacterized protein n=1 Tax=Somion occarium TaxID=3059160 RepID=A0ABP1CSK0_9APHY
MTVQGQLVESRSVSAVKCNIVRERVGDVSRRMVKTSRFGKAFISSDVNMVKELTRDGLRTFREGNMVSWRLVTLARDTCISTSVLARDGTCRSDRFNLCGE